LPSNQSKRRTPRQLISRAGLFLEASGIDEPFRNAELLLSHVMGRPVVDLYLDWDQEVSAGQEKSFLSLVEKRSGAVPLQYLTGSVDFFGYRLIVRKGVFIPRPETELLVEEALDIYRRHFSPKPVRILDIGTGSGNISVALAGEIPESRITATDISQDALDAACENGRLHGVGERIKFIRQDSFPAGCGRFHLILSNPPYIPDREMLTLQDEVKNEPTQALRAGAAGMDVIERILAGAYRYLEPGGYLILEIGYGQAKMVRKIECGLRFCYIKKDLSGIERYPVFKKENHGQVYHRGRQET